MKSISRILLALCSMFIALHILGAMRPSHENWGVHLFAFYPLWISAIALVASLSLLVPAVRASIGKRAAKFALWSARLPGPIILLAVGGILILLASLSP